MRNETEQSLALACLSLANRPEVHPDQIVRDARQYLAFITGSDTGGAEAKLEQVRAAIG